MCTLRRLFFLSALLLLSTSLTVSAQDSSYVPSHELPEGQELVFVYLGSYDCGPCHKPELKRAINEAKLLLDQKAEEAGKSFSAVGVDMGWSVEKGIDFLRETGRFDEIMVGRSWTGSAGTRYIWREEVTSPSKPSMVVYERRVTPEDRISISEPTYLVSKSGVSNIVEWVEDGAPVRNGSSGGKR